jgi:hypothetical protein
MPGIEKSDSLDFGFDKDLYNKTYKNIDKKIKEKVDTIISKYVLKISKYNLEKQRIITEKILVRINRIHSKFLSKI